MAATDLYEVLVVLPPQNAWRTLAGLDATAGISRFPTRIAIGDRAESHPAWAAPVTSADLIGELRHRLPEEVISHLRDAVLNGCGLVQLRFVPEPALAAISEGFQRVVQSDGATMQAYYRSLRVRELPLALAFPERDAARPVNGGILPIVAADVAPGGSLVATTDAATTRLWRPGSAQELRAVKASGSSVSFVLGGSAVQVTDLDLRRFIDVATGRVLTEQPAAAAVSPSGLLVAAAAHGLVAVTDIRGGREMWRAEGDRFAWATDDRLFVSALASGPTFARDSRTGTALVEIPGYAPTPAPDGESVITVDGGELAIWDARSGRLRTRLAGLAMPTDPWASQSSVLAYDPAVRVVLIRDRNNALLVVDSLTGEVSFRLHGNAADLIGGASVVLTSDFAYDAITGRELYRTGRGHVVSDSAGRSIALAQLPGGVETQVLDARSGRLRFEAAGAPLRFGGRGSLLVTALDDGRAALYDANSGSQLAALGTMRVLSVLETSKAGGGAGSAFTIGRLPNPRDLAGDLRHDEWSGQPGGNLLEEELSRQGPDSSVPEVEYVHRYVVVTGPDAVTPEIAFDISAALVRDRPADLPWSSPVALQPTIDTAGAATGAPEVSFALYAAPAFAMLSPAKFSVEVPADSDPEPATFRLVATAKADGPHEVSVVLWQGWLLIGRVKLVIKIEAEPRPLNLVRRSLTVPPPGERAAAPEVAIYVSRVSAGGRDTLHYSYEWPARGWPRVDAGSVELLTTADRWLSDKFELLSSAARQAGPGGGDEPAGREFERIGENLYSQLFTDELKAFYAKFAGTAKSLLLFSDEPWIPWELVKPWGGGIDGDFLCAQFDFARWYYSRSGKVPRSDLLVSEVAPIIPQSDLPATWDEARFFQGLPGQWPSVSLHRPLPVRRSEVLEILSGGLTQLVHFAAHGSLRDDGGIAAIELADGLLKAEDIVGNLVESGLRSATPVVFMNACHSGRQVIGLTRPDGWVERCIDLGCRGFLGANWEVNDQLAATFAIEVYNRLVRREPIAAAVRGARQLLRSQDPANPTWLSYSLYAHPDMTLLAAGSSAR
jgi:CHAT domain